MLEEVADRFWVGLGGILFFFFFRVYGRFIEYIKVHTI